MKISRICNKCGYDGVDIRYCGPGQNNKFGSGFCSLGGEHLHFRCQQCGYLWEEATLDAGENP